MGRILSDGFSVHRNGGWQVPGSMNQRGIGRVDPAVAWQQLRRFLRLSWGAVDQFKFAVLGFRLTM